MNEEKTGGIGWRNGRLEMGKSVVSRVAMIHNSTVGWEIQETGNEGFSRFPQLCVQYRARAFELLSLQSATLAVLREY